MKNVCPFSSRSVALPAPVMDITGIGMYRALIAAVKKRLTDKALVRYYYLLGYKMRIFIFLLEIIVCACKFPCSVIHLTYEFNW